MTGQNDRQDERLTGQVCNQAGHCPLTSRYFQPWNRVTGTTGITGMFGMTSMTIPVVLVSIPTLTKLTGVTG